MKRPFGYFVWMNNSNTLSYIYKNDKVQEDIYMLYLVSNLEKCLIGTLGEHYI